jgi:predicted transcriptional regulator
MKIKTGNVLTVRMSDSMKEKVFQQAEKYDATGAEIVRTAVKFYLNSL